MSDASLRGDSRAHRGGYLVVLLSFVLCASCGSETPKQNASSNPGDVDERPVVYQLVVRYFGNVDGTNEPDGSLAENGVGKFAHVNDRALTELRELGTTHVWLTGVLQQATATDYSRIDHPPDDPDVLKGRAGSFFAVEDYFDVSPDYALDPANRMQEFEALVERIHDHDMKVLLDLVPNHVARTYHSDVKPELDFGRDDDTSTFFDPQNNFFYLVEPEGQSLTLPNPSHWERPAGADGTIEREDNDGTPAGDVPKVTGNNQATASPSTSDWYETVKLNYGYNFATGESSYEPIPDTWKKMNRVIAYWQKKGVDGFRADFAHLVPVEAWTYLIDRAEQRDEDVYFMAEAYRSPRAPPGFSLPNLIQVGFDAVYDDATYDRIKEVFCCGKWANDLPEVLPGDFMFDKYVRYAENHDERRIASPIVEGEGSSESGFGSIEAGKPVTGTLFLSGAGPMFLFNGQTVGEPGAGREGFDGEDGRTTIFDYWTMPQMAKWVNDHRYDGGPLDETHRQLRQWYADLVELGQKPGFASGEIYVLQNHNKNKDGYTGGEHVFSFLRYDVERDVTWLVVANYDDSDHSPVVGLPKQALEFTNLNRHDTIVGEPALSGSDSLEMSTDDAPKGTRVSMPSYGLRVFRLTGGSQ